MRKIAFLDRDGALIFEPPTDFQIDSIEKLKILPGVIDALKKLLEMGYELVMVTNQNGVGTASFPREDFDAPQERMLEIFAENGVNFAEVFMCPHFPEDECLCRKPKLGMVKHFLATNEIDFENSFLYGDRDSDGEFAKNIGIKFIKTETNSNCTLIQDL
jgi:imidazoleglycerol-phosphate dehydratase/histidinol-phosphatase